MSKAKEEDEEEEEKKKTVNKKGEEELKENNEFKLLHEIFKDGKYHLIPSFFRTLIYLKKAKREFAVVFRSFGADISNTVFEFNKFC